MFDTYWHLLNLVVEIRYLVKLFVPNWHDYQLNVLLVYKICDFLLENYIAIVEF